MTCAYFSVSATWNWRQPSFEKISARLVTVIGGNATSTGKPGLVLGHGHDVEVARPLAAVEGRGVELVAVDERVGQLPRAIGAEVEVDHDVAVADTAVDAVDDARLDELVVLAAAIAVEDGLAAETWR